MNIFFDLGDPDLVAPAPLSGGSEWVFFGRVVKRIRGECKTFDVVEPFLESIVNPGESSVEIKNEELNWIANDANCHLLIQKTLECLPAIGQELSSEQAEEWGKLSDYLQRPGYRNFLESLLVSFFLSRGKKLLAKSESGNEKFNSSVEMMTAVLNDLFECLSDSLKIVRTGSDEAIRKKAEDIVDRLLSELFNSTGLRWSALKWCGRKGVSWAYGEPKACFVDLIVDYFTIYRQIYRMAEEIKSSEDLSQFQSSFDFVDSLVESQVKKFNKDLEHQLHRAFDRLPKDDDGHPRFPRFLRTSLFGVLHDVITEQALRRKNLVDQIRTVLLGSFVASEEGAFQERAKSAFGKYIPDFQKWVEDKSPLFEIVRNTDSDLGLEEIYLDEFDNQVSRSLFRDKKEELLWESYYHAVLQVQDGEQRVKEFKTRILSLVMRPLAQEIVDRYAEENKRDPHLQGLLEKTIPSLSRLLSDAAYDMNFYHSEHTDRVAEAKEFIRGLDCRKGAQLLSVIEMGVDKGLSKFKENNLQFPLIWGVADAVQEMVNPLSETDDFFLRSLLNDMVPLFTAMILENAEGTNLNQKSEWLTRVIMEKIQGSFERRAAGEDPEEIYRQLTEEILQIFLPKEETEALLPEVLPEVLKGRLSYDTIFNSLKDSLFSWIHKLFEEIPQVFVDGDFFGKALLKSSDLTVAYLKGQLDFTDFPYDLELAEESDFDQFTNILAEDVVQKVYPVLDDPKINEDLKAQIREYLRQEILNHIRTILADLENPERAKQILLDFLLDHPAESYDHIDKKIGKAAWNFVFRQLPLPIRLPLMIFCAPLIWIMGLIVSKMVINLIPVIFEREDYHLFVRKLVLENYKLLRRDLYEDLDKDLKDRRLQKNIRTIFSKAHWAYRPLGYAGSFFVHPPVKRMPEYVSLGMAEAFLRSSG